MNCDTSPSAVAELLQRSSASCMRLDPHFVENKSAFGLSSLAFAASMVNNKSEEHKAAVKTKSKAALAMKISARDAAELGSNWR
jgi:hypothetical protein